ncbi:MAG: Uncharacterized protein G01um101420_472 [Parcubacteria group bacterium Gr01-1014_20]|nr:MAG: Uncharacterized protein G01um101420_472 [Parcubacteria group bacterium Gr01-1014_20]
MENPNKNSESGPSGDKFVKNIRFNLESGTLLLDLDKNKTDPEKVRGFAEERGLLEKDEAHVTVIGSDTAEQIMARLGDLPRGEKEEILAKIRAVVESIDWQFVFKPEYYYIKKEYDDPDPTDSSKIIHEVRESVIQLAETGNLAEFYAKLKEVTGLELEVPMPHVTLFTTSTREDKRKRGIGIYSERDFDELKPERIEI